MANHFTAGSSTEGFSTVESSTAGMSTASMPASNAVPDDTILKAALVSRRQIYLQGFQADIPPAERERLWNTYLHDLANSPTPVSNIGNANQPMAHGISEHLTPPEAPERKKRRLDSKDSRPTPGLSISTDCSTANPSGHLTKHEYGLPPIDEAGALVPAPLLRRRSTGSKPPPTQHMLNTTGLSPVLYRKDISTVQSRHIPALERTPEELFGAQAQPDVGRSPYVDQTHNYVSTAPQSSPLQSTSSYSSYGEISLGDLTTPTSISMSRENSLGSSFAQGGFHMMRLSSAQSATSQHSFSMAPPLENDLGLLPSQNCFVQSPTSKHDIIGIGAQFADQREAATAPAMQKQISSNSDLPHPDQADASMTMSRTSSTTTRDGLDYKTTVFEDGSSKEAIKLDPVSRVDRPTKNKVMCNVEGCNSQPQGFKGLHELRRHFDVRHAKKRLVWICKPLAADPGFLSKVNCRKCETHKEYHAEYNAGEHLRRIHFNPRQPKDRGAGKIQPAEKRGGKSGGKWPTMEELRKYMIIRVVDTDDTQTSTPEEIEPLSSVILSNTSISSQTTVKAMQAFSDATLNLPIPPSASFEKLFDTPDMFTTNVSSSSSAYDPEEPFAGQDAEAVLQTDGMRSRPGDLASSGSQFTVMDLNEASIWASMHSSSSGSGPLNEYFSPIPACYHDEL